jgi:hypothetical protein
MSVNYGSKRVVTGAHYGLRDWLAQRITAALVALLTLIVLAKVLLTSGPIGYEGWAGIFAAQWMKALTFAVFVALPTTCGSACATSGWTTSSPPASAWFCTCSPSSGSWPAWAGLFKFSGGSDS